MRATGRVGPALAFVAALGAWSSAAGAACDDPTWDLARTAETLSAAKPADAGATFARDMGAALVVTLVPEALAGLALPPERPAKNADPKAAALGFAAGGAGTYRIALSGEAWIDVVQGGKHVPSIDFIGFHDCPAVRKIVTFEIGAGPFTLQVSDAPAATISVAILRAE